MTKEVTVRTGTPSSPFISSATRMEASIMAGSTAKPPPAPMARPAAASCALRNASWPGKSRLIHTSVRKAVAIPPSAAAPPPSTVPGSMRRRTCSAVYPSKRRVCPVRSTLSSAPPDSGPPPATAPMAPWACAIISASVRV